MTRDEIRAGARAWFEQRFGSREALDARIDAAQRRQPWLVVVPTIVIVGTMQTLDTVFDGVELWGQPDWVRVVGLVGFLAGTAVMVRSLVLLVRDRRAAAAAGRRPLLLALPFAERRAAYRQVMGSVAWSREDLPLLRLVALAWLPQRPIVPLFAGTALMIAGMGLFADEVYLLGIVAVSGLALLVNAGLHVRRARAGRRFLGT